MFFFSFSFLLTNKGTYLGTKPLRVSDYLLIPHVHGYYKEDVATP